MLNHHQTPARLWRSGAKATAFALLAFWGMAGVAQAQNVTKANNNTTMSNTGSWVGGVLPNATTYILLNNTLTSSISANVGTGVTTKGIIVTNTGGNFTMAAKSSNTTTIGSGGIDMSSADNGSNSLTIASPVVLAANQTFNVSSNRSLTINGTVTNGGFDLTTAGSGAIVLTGVMSGAGNVTVESNGGSTTLGANSANFTGNVTVVNGTLLAQGNNNALGTGNVTIGNASTQINEDLALLINTASRNIGNNITIGNFGNSTTLGTTAVTGTSTFSGTISLGKDIIINQEAGATLRFNGTLSGTGGFTKTGGGTVTLNGTLANSGNIIVSAGTLNIVATTDTVNKVTLIDGCLTATTGVLTANSFELQNGFSNATLDGAGANLYKTTNGTVTLNHASTFTGNAVIVDGTVGVMANGALGAGAIVLGNASTQSGDDLVLDITNSGRVVANDIIVANTGNSTTIGGNNTSGTATFSGNIAVNKEVTISALTSNVQFTGNISGTGNLSLTGSGNVVFKGNNDSATGAVNVASGTLSIAGGSALGDTAAVTVASGANISSNASETFGSLAGAGNVSVTNNVVLTVGGNNQDTTYSGVIQGGNANSGMVKEGTGTMTLTGSNTYAGPTTVNGGTLLLSATGGNQALANTSTLTINTGGTVMLGASDQVNPSATLNLAGGTLNLNNQSLGSASSAGLGSLTLSANSSLTLGGSSAVVAFSASNGASWTASTTLDIQGWSDPGQIYFGTSSTGLTTSQLSEIVFINPFGDGQNWNASLMSDGRLVPAPEPATYLAGALLAGLAAIAELRRRRKKQA